MRFLFVISLLLAAMTAHAADERFVPVCMNGEVAGKGTCPVQPKPGRQAGDWACTRDGNTSLTWSIESGKGNWNYARGDYAQAANREGRCGFTSGWRLPTRDELLTLLVKESGPLARMQALWKKHGSGQAAIDARYFPETRPDAYWTSDSLVPDPTLALFVYFKPGFDNEGNSYAETKSEENLIRLVHDPR